MPEVSTEVSSSLLLPTNQWRAATADPRQRQLFLSGGAVSTMHLFHRATCISCQCFDLGTSLFHKHWSPSCRSPHWEMGLSFSEQIDKPKKLWFGTCWHFIFKQTHNLTCIPECLCSFQFRHAWNQNSSVIGHLQGNYAFALLRLVCTTMTEIKG